MPFPITRLDNVFPPTWESVWGGTHPEPYDPHIDSESRVRFITGEDPVNYFTAQRFQGDLFKRDILQSQSIRRIIDYLASRNGYFYNIPSVTLAPNTYIPLGAMMSTEQIEGYYLVAYVCNIHYGAISDIELRVIDQDTGAVLGFFNPTGNQNISWAVSLAQIDGKRGKLVDNFEIRLYNKGSSDIITAQASVILSPKLNWDGIGGSSSYSEGEASPISEYTPPPPPPLPYVPGGGSNQFGGDYLHREANLEDVPNKETARSNLELLTNAAYLDNLWKLMKLRDYPVGALYTTTAGHNPTIYFGFGSWERYATGKALVGVDPNDTDFNEVGRVGGAKTHTLTISEIPSHSHQLPYNPSNHQTGGNGQDSGEGTRNYSNSNLTNLTGGGQPHNNLQPYVAVNIWRRTA
jgi:hypothetical protein